MNNTFSIKTALKFGLVRTKEFWATMLGIGFITIIISAIPQLLAFLLGAKTNQYGQLDLTSLSGVASLTYWSIYFIILFISIVLGYNSVKMMLKMTDGHKVEMTELFAFDSATLKNAWKYFLATLAYGLIVLIGLILLVLPGLYFAAKYAFVPYLVLDKALSIKEAFTKSAEMTLNKKWYLALMYFMSMLVVMAGFIALLVGVIPAIMIISFAFFYVYRKLADGKVHGEEKLSA